MTPKEVHLWFRGRERTIERTEKAAWTRAIVQAYHTERFARLKKLSPADLKKLLTSLEHKGPQARQTPQQLWAFIRATHELVSKGQKKTKGNARG